MESLAPPTLNGVPLAHAGSAPVFAVPMVPPEKSTMPAVVRHMDIADVPVSHRSDLLPTVQTTTRDSRVAYCPTVLRTHARGIEILWSGDCIHDRDEAIEIACLRADRIATAGFLSTRNQVLAVESTVRR